MRKRHKSPDNLKLFALEYTASSVAVLVNHENERAAKEQKEKMAALKKEMPGKSDLEIQRWSLRIAEKSLAQERKKE